MLKNLFNKLFLSKYLGSFIRHAMTALAGWLVSKGIIADASIVESMTTNMNEIITGVVLYLLGQGTSIAEKKKE